MLILMMCTLIIITGRSYGQPPARSVDSSWIHDLYVKEDQENPMDKTSTITLDGGETAHIIAYPFARGINNVGRYKIEIHNGDKNGPVIETIITGNSLKNYGVRNSVPLVGRCPSSIYTIHVVNYSPTTSEFQSMDYSFHNGHQPDHFIQHIVFANSANSYDPDSDGVVVIIMNNF